MKQNPMREPFALSIPDDPRRVAGFDELESDAGYRESTEEHDADAWNDELWLADQLSVNEAVARTSQSP